MINKSFSKFKIGIWGTITVAAILLFSVAVTADDEVINDSGMYSDVRITEIYVDTSDQVTMVFDMPVCRSSSGAFVYVAKTPEDWSPDDALSPDDVDTTNRVLSLATQAYLARTRVRVWAKNGGMCTLVALRIL